MRESISSNLGRSGGDAIVKDRPLPGRQGERHYAPADLSGWKIGSRISEVTEKAGDRLHNPTTISRIVSTASWRIRLLPVAKRWGGGAARLGAVTERLFPTHDRYAVSPLHRFAVPLPIAARRGGDGGHRA